MGIIVGLVGGFGAILAGSGALVALFTGGVGFTAGADQADVFTARAVGAIFASLIGFAGAITARKRLQLGASLLLVSSLLGIAFAFWFFIAGAVMMLAAAAIALWPADPPDEPASR